MIQRRSGVLSILRLAAGAALVAGCGLALVAGCGLGSSWARTVPAAGGAVKAKVERKAGPGAVRPRVASPFTPVALPDSFPEDLRAAWALRARVGRAYWPEWVGVAPAPVVLRASSFDFFINHPQAPGAATAPSPIPGGGGTFQAVIERLGYPQSTSRRLEMQGGVQCVPYDANRGRPGTRPGIAAMLAYRDFLAFETRVGKPVFATVADTGSVRVLRSSPDLVEWLNQEGKALRQAVAAPSDSERIAWTKKALQAADGAGRTAARQPALATALAWARAARRSEGAALYLQVFLQAEAAAVAAGDTARALPGGDAPFAERQRVWRERAASISDRAVTGAHLGTIYEVGALYCVLLDAWSPGWQGRIFGPDFGLEQALGGALGNAGNRGGAGG